MSEYRRLKPYRLPLTVTIWGSQAEIRTLEDDIKFLSNSGYFSPLHAGLLFRSITTLWSPSLEYMSSQDDSKYNQLTTSIACIFSYETSTTLHLVAHEPLMS